MSAVAAALLSAALLSTPPQSVRAALALEEAGDDAGAIAALQEAVKRTPLDIDVRLELARLLLKSGTSLDQAARHLELARVHRPQAAMPHWLYASLLEEQGKPWEAAKSLERVLVVQPSHAEARFRVASLYERLGDLLHAEYHYRRLSREKPEWAVARLQLAVVLENQGRREDAVKEVEALLELQPQAELVKRRLAELYDRAGRTADAEALRKTGKAPPKKLRPLKPSKR